METPKVDAIIVMAHDKNKHKYKDIELINKLMDFWLLDIFFNPGKIPPSKPTIVVSLELSNINFSKIQNPIERQAELKNYEFIGSSEKKLPEKIKFINFLIDKYKWKDITLIVPEENQKEYLNKINKKVILTFK